MVPADIVKSLVEALLLKVVVPGELKIILFRELVSVNVPERVLFASYILPLASYFWMSQSLSELGRL